MAPTQRVRSAQIGGGSAQNAAVKESVSEHSKKSRHRKKKIFNLIAHYTLRLNKISYGNMRFILVDSIVREQRNEQHFYICNPHAYSLLKLTMGGNDGADARLSREEWVLCTKQ